MNPLEKGNVARYVGGLSFRGTIVVWICHFCSREWATYANAMPKGWRTVAPGKVACRLCQRDHA